MNKSSELAIKVVGLAKSFGEIEVLKDINFELPTGQVLALLGPNGAGKTTTVKILATLLKANAGKAEVAGFKVGKQDDKIRASIGLTGQFAAVDEYLTGRENVIMIGQLYHLGKKESVKRADELLEKFDLVEAANRPAKTYSGGMTRRLDLAMSLVASPPVLFLDEPTTGLDPRSRLTLWNMVKDLAKSGVSVLLTTQQMEEAEYLADSVIVIDHGKIIAKGTVNELKAKAGSEQVELTFQSEEELKKAEKILESAAVMETKQALVLPAKKGLTSLKEVLDKLEKAKITPDTAGLRRPTLDDVFLALTGHAAEVEVSEVDKNLPPKEVNDEQSKICHQ